METITPQRVVELIERLAKTKCKHFHFSNTEKTINFVFSVYRDTDDDDDVIELRYEKLKDNIRSIVVRNKNDYDYDSDCDEDDGDYQLTKILGFMLNKIKSTQGHKDQMYKRVAEEMNICFAMKICECEKDFIFDGGELCYECELMKPLPENTKECNICGRSVHKNQFEETSCCHQDIHTECKKKCEKCPYCRKKY